jgi:hypothetical protein
MSTPKTPQAVFNKVAKHLLKQKERSVGSLNGRDRCLYRGPNGLKCAVGCLIPNKMYSPDMEGKILGRDVLAACGLPGSMVPLLISLQIMHDHCLPKEWPDRLRGIAKDYNLDASVLDGM